MTGNDQSRRKSNRKNSVVSMNHFDRYGAFSDIFSNLEFNWTLTDR